MSFCKRVFIVFMGLGLSFVLFAGSGWADVAARGMMAPRCLQPELMWLVPGNGYKEIPTDAKIYMAFTNVNCRRDFQFRLMSDKGKVEFERKNWSFMNNPGDSSRIITVLSPKNPFEPLTSYQFEINGAVRLTTTFRTGQKKSEALKSKPTVDSLKVLVDTNNVLINDTLHEFSVSLKSSSEWGLLFVKIGKKTGFSLEDPNGANILMPNRKAFNGDSHLFRQRVAEGKEQCITVTQMNPAGAWGPSVVRCVKPVKQELSKPPAPPVQPGTACQLSPQQRPLSGMHLLWGGVFLLCLLGFFRVKVRP